MKKSKSSSKKRERSSPDDSKSKRAKVRPETSGKEKVKVKVPGTKSVPRKTRWQAEEKKDPKNEPIAEPATKEEKSGPPLRIKDSLHDKEKIVDLLFQTVTGAALQELIPDYLKKRSSDELKKLCLEQMKAMSDDSILQVISGKVDSSNKEEKVVEKEKILKSEQPNESKEKEEEKEITHDSDKKLEEASKVDATDKLTNFVPQLAAATSPKMEEKVDDEENQIPLVIKDEVAKDLILPERDAELLELEMRARAIRSLLKAKSQSSNEEDNKEKD